MTVMKLVFVLITAAASAAAAAETVQKKKNTTETPPRWQRAQKHTQKHNIEPSDLYNHEQRMTFRG